MTKQMTNKIMRSEMRYAAWTCDRAAKVLREAQERARKDGHQAEAAAECGPAIKQLEDAQCYLRRGAKYL